MLRFQSPTVIQTVCVLGVKGIFKRFIISQMSVSKTSVVVVATLYYSAEQVEVKELMYFKRLPAEISCLFFFAVRT